MAVFFLNKGNSPVLLISKSVNFLIHDYVNFEKKNVNTGYTFYFIEFEVNFFRTSLLLAATWQ